MKAKYYVSVLLACTLMLFTSAQRIHFTNISVGYKVFEIEPVGNNPTTISPLLKKPLEYENYLRSLNYNGITGSPAIQRIHIYYLNTEFNKRSSSHFWKHYTIHLGVNVSKRLVKDNMAVGRQETVITPTDTLLRIQNYSLVQQQQFAGLNAGINRRFKLGKSLSFITGIQVQGSIAFVHNYKQQLDSTTVNLSYSNYSRKTSSMIFQEKLRGKNFLQWQAMVPLGLELNIYKSKFFVRGELEAGIIWGKYRPKGSNNLQALGLGAWIIYKL